MTLLNEHRIPERFRHPLALTLWDFSWYLRAEPGGPFASIESALDEAVDRGYGAVRICAAPMLIAGGLGLSSEIEVSGLGPAPTGAFYGQRTRWYDVPGGYRIDVRERLLALLDGARRRGIAVVLATWEYQQSSSMAADAAWWEAMDAVPLAERYDALAEAWHRLLGEIDAAGLSDTIAFVELHNEVDFSLVPSWPEGGARALARLRAQHPDVLVTASWGKPPHLDMPQIGDGLDVAQFHIYAYGVLDALQKRIDLREEGSAGFPNAELRALLRDDAPAASVYGRPADWRMRATVITDQMVYGYDWIDVERWDAWLYAHYQEHRAAMLADIDARLTGVASWARRQGIPLAVGEGWVGYTPRDGGFEEGPAGHELAEHGIRRARELGAWMVVTCSNAAPHHPMWTQRDWQRRMAQIVTAP